MLDKIEVLTQAPVLEYVDMVWDSKTIPVEDKYALQGVVDEIYEEIEEAKENKELDEMVGVYDDAFEAIHTERAFMVRQRRHHFNNRERSCKETYRKGRHQNKMYIKNSDAFCAGVSGYDWKAKLIEAVEINEYEEDLAHGIAEANRQREEDARIAEEEEKAWEIHEMDNHPVEFVSYSGKYPCYCSGVLTLRIGEKEYRFGHSYYNPENYEDFWVSGGHGNVDRYENPVKADWIFYKEALPKELQDRAEEIFYVFRENVAPGCCGGCL